MRVLIAAVGRLKDGPERTLYGTYAKRFDALGRSHALGPVALQEIPENRAKSASVRKDEEAGRLLALLEPSDRLVVLDERGPALASREFANFVADWRDEGVRRMVFALGGADGHGPAMAKAAQKTLSLGPMTLPHGLARILLIEQLFRAVTIISGHPYHRQ